LETLSLVTSVGLGGWCASVIRWRLLPSGA
jgi:hypothetical protein